MLVKTSEPADSVPMLVEFLRSAATFQCQQVSTRFEERQAPRGQAIQRSNGSRRHPGHRRYPTDDGALFGATAHHADPPRQRQCGYCFLEKRHSAGHGLDEVDAQIRPCAGKDDAG
jgi:hypothetical protein